MYKIIDIETNEIIGFTINPYYIRYKEETGILIKANINNAQGIAYKSIPYNLSGKDGVNAEKTVALMEYDISDLILDIPTLENAICELDIAYEERLSMIEDALCELDKEEI